MSSTPPEDDGSAPSSGQPRGPRLLLAAAASAAALAVPAPALVGVDVPAAVLGAQAATLLAAGVVVTKAVARLRAGDQQAVRTLIGERTRALDAVAERDAMASQLAYEAEHDVLTGLLNRSSFLDHLVSALTDRADGEALGVLFIDLDDFKVVNDTFGHAAGDELLVDVALRLRNALRGDDVVARFGGDEFAVLLHRQASPDLAVGVGARLLGILRAPFALGAGMASGAASGGIALQTEPTDDPTQQAAELMRRADLAMYAAKAAGGGRCVPFEAQMQAQMVERRALQDDLRRALIEDELTLVYQPVVDVRTRRVVAVEALSRWPHPERGSIPPSVFIPIAEESGAIVDLGMWVLEQACLDLQLWDELCPGNEVCIAVNVSARQLREPAVGPQIARVLHRMAVDPRRVVLEVTESLLMEDGESAAATLWQLRGLGIRIAVDDFGTGYSSLSRLVDLPLDDLKIDRAFVAELEHSDAGATIVSAAIAMAHGLGLTVVAEGVESEQQLEFLAAAGCDRAQGYVLSPPVPMDGITGMLRRGRPSPRPSTAVPGPRLSGTGPLRARPTATALPVKHKHR